VWGRGRVGVRGRGRGRVRGRVGVRVRARVTCSTAQVRSPSTSCWVSELEFGVRCEPSTVAMM